MPKNIKNEIVESFFCISKRKDVDKITVKDLVTECGISRQSFYYHFQDILEVSEWSFQQKLLEILKLANNTEKPIDAIRIYIHIMEENRSILKKLRSSGRRDQMEKILIQTTRECMESLVKNKVENSKIARKDLDFLLDFYSLAFSEYILVNIEENTDEEVLANQILVLLEGKMSIFS